MDTALMSEIDEIRIDPDLTESMIRIAASEISNGVIASRLEGDCKIMTRALRMGHEILVATTLAQASKDETTFADLLARFAFSARDDDLKTVGRIMLAKIRKAARIPDEGISDSVLASRFNQIKAAI